MKVYVLHRPVEVRYGNAADQLCFFKEDGLMLQTCFLSVCKGLISSEISFTDLCRLFVDACETVPKVLVCVFISFLSFCL